MREWQEGLTNYDVVLDMQDFKVIEYCKEMRLPRNLHSTFVFHCNNSSLLSDTVNVGYFLGCV